MKNIVSGFILQFEDRLSRKVPDGLFDSDDPGVPVLRVADRWIRRTDDGGFEFEMPGETPRRLNYGDCLENWYRQFPPDLNAEPGLRIEGKTLYVKMGDASYTNDLSYMGEEEYAKYKRDLEYYQDPRNKTCVGARDAFARFPHIQFWGNPRVRVEFRSLISARSGYPRFRSTCRGLGELRLNTFDLG